MTLSNLASRGTDPAEAKKRQGQWEQINFLVQQLDGWVVSAPGKRVRIEFQNEGVEIPARLRALGFKVYDCGTSERLLLAGVVPTSVIEISIDGK